MTVLKKLGAAFVIGCAASIVSMSANASWWDDDDDHHYDRWYGGGPWYGGYPGYGWGGYPGYGGWGYPGGYGGGPRTIIVNPAPSDSQREEAPKPPPPR